ncbi:HTTM domain-containing protein [Aureispira sp. CCB-QB1]|uniref:HTTM domain-containing protein n=1 Tax=Aureispira sp. CCB-QB1 TaxID=1313421 RepID=UPI000698AF18|nr:HTTM domain-containing protein [Aureispira sp. CCB-QB1]
MTEVANIDKKVGLRAHLFESVPAESLALFRMAWGVIMFYFFGKLILWTNLGKLRYIDPIFHFRYPGFEWLEILPPGLMNFTLYLGCILAVMLLLGVYYRFASIAMAVVYIYVFLIDVSYWNNHYYAYALVAIFFATTDAHQAFSIDKWRLGLSGKIPRWQLYLFRFQFLVIYFYGGLSKLQNKDWIDNMAGYSLVENSFALKGWSVKHHIIYPCSMLITWGGIFFDLFIGGLLLCRRTLWLAFILVVSFNMTNALFLRIGTFPYTMLLSFVLFIPPVELAAFINKRFRNKQLEGQAEVVEKQTASLVYQSVVMISLGVFVVFQLLFPFRSWAIDGSVFWTKEGKLYSWHMMSGSSDVYAKMSVVEMDDTKTVELGYSELVPENFLSPRQVKSLGIWPTLVPQFARFLKKEAELAGFKNVEIRGEILVSRNKRPFVPIVHPDVDLASVETHYWKHNDWILRYSDEDGYFK